MTTVEWIGIGISAVTLMALMWGIMALNGMLSVNRQEALSASRDVQEVRRDLLQFQAVLREEMDRSREELGRNREAIDRVLRESREEMGRLQRDQLSVFQGALTSSIQQFNATQDQKFNLLLSRHQELTQMTDQRLTAIGQTVDEKLQASVEKRFNESFRLISDRLDQVHKGLGEMQSLASGVGDLKKVLTNVKTRGIMGEIQLGAILDQMLSPEQFERNAQVKQGSMERVEYAIKLPGHQADNRPLLLPIDSKFPLEDYQRLVALQQRDDGRQDASESKEGGEGPVSPQLLEEQIGKQLENAIKKAAKDIKDKYIDPPRTTDFAILFVPTEGLYAEVLRRPGLFELLQRDYKITVVGPTNLVAFLSSLQMGFRTLAIERRSSEVWDLLGAVKTEFSKFGEVLMRTRKKLEEATSVIDQAQVRTRAIERKLKGVEALPEAVEALPEAVEALPEVVEAENIHGLGPLD